MIVTVVRFAGGDLLGLPEATARFGASASSYLEVPGLLWKAYLLSDDGRTVGGAYWWRDRASAEAALDDEWREGVTAEYGRPPTIEWFEAPVVVDRVSGCVRLGPPAVSWE